MTFKISQISTGGMEISSLEKLETVGNCLPEMDADNYQLISGLWEER